MEQYKKVVDEGLQTDLNITADCLAEIQKNKMELKEEYKSLLKYSHKYKCNLRRIISLSIIIVMLCVGSAFFGGYLKYNSLKNDIQENKRLSKEEIEYIESFGGTIYNDFEINIENIKDIEINLYSSHKKNIVYFFINIKSYENKFFSVTVNNINCTDTIIMFLMTDESSIGKNKVNIVVNVDEIEYVYNLTI